MRRVVKTTTMSQAEPTTTLSQDELAGNTKTASTKPMREAECQAYRWAFTLKCKGEPDEPEALWLLLTEIAKEFYFQMEVGESGYIHFQGCLSLKVKHRRVEVKNMMGRFDVHLETVKDWAASKKYCQKEKSRLGGPWSHKSSFIKVDEPYGWQLYVMDIINIQPEKREIWWFWDKDGKKGKSDLAKYLYVRYNATVLNNGRFTDIACAIPEQPKIVVFDLPRTLESKVNYTAIECIKNGMIFSGKYESKTKAYNPPHVIVFANFEPCKETLSLDRWIVVNIDEII
jgi:translation initiation factor 2 beta subunit (eIF-2beta)/eIF-5